MLGGVRSRVVSTVGTVCRNVMRFSSRKSASPGPTWRPSVGPATRVAPVAQVVQSSSREKSNEIERPWYTRSLGSTAYTSDATVTKLQMDECAIATPLGRPVEPEV